MADKKAGVKFASQVAKPFKEEDKGEPSKPGD